MAYNTGNPSGSSDPRDLSDSSADIDTWATSTTADTHPDRLGVSRKTWHGMENEFDADQVARASEYAADKAYRDTTYDDAQADRAQRFDLFLANSGYQFVGDYAAGIELTEYNQVVRDASGNLWRVSASTSLPYTTTGAGLPEGGSFIAIGDADLAQNLISDPSTGKGAFLVRGSVIYVDTIAELQALPTSELVDGQAAVSAGSHFVWNAAGARWEPLGAVSIESYGGIPDDGSSAARNANEAALTGIEAENKQPLLAGGRSYYVNDGYDVWQHRFVAGRACTLYIGAVAYDVSNAIWGLYRIDDFTAGSNGYLTLKNARDDITIARISSGENPSDSHVFQLPIDVRKNGHSLLSSPTSPTGRSDIVFRTHNFSDAFYIFNEPEYQNEQLIIATDTLSANPDGSKKTSYAFDSALIIPGNDTTKPMEIGHLRTRIWNPVDFSLPRSSFNKILKPGNYKFGLSKIVNSSDLYEFVRANSLYSKWHGYGRFKGSMIADDGTTGLVEGTFIWVGDAAATSVNVTFEKNTLPAGVALQPLQMADNRAALWLRYLPGTASGSEAHLSIECEVSISAY